MSNYNEETGITNDVHDDLNERLNDGQSDNIVKLQVDGASRVVNTIQDQKTAMGRSLVCPFPALEVDIPIRFTDAGGEECEGRIHRIGVEDDPETGLPKLRLSVRTVKDDRETMLRAPAEELLAEASALTAVPQEVVTATHSTMDDFAEMGVTDTGIDVVVDFPEDRRVTAESLEAAVSASLSSVDIPRPNTQISEEIELGDNVLMDRLFDDLQETTTAELLSLEDVDACKLQEHKGDPQWVCYSDMPIPSAIKERAQTRRRRRAVAIAAWMMVLGIAAGGVYVLGKAGVVNVDKAKQYVSMDDSTPKATDSLAQLSDKSEATEAAQTRALTDAVVTDERPELVEAAAEEMAEIEATDGKMVDAGDAEASEVAVNEEVAENDDVVVSSESEMNAEEEKDAVSALSTDVVLPTRWPAEFATSYRLQNPNGVVVDVPGGLVKREGWLTLKEGDKIIRSIKAVQRENGARFIVYVHGNLPNFKTSPRNGGIRLSLYYDAREQKSSDTQQVAMLDN
ncbi:MAG: hypothetical protein JXR76_29325 [Deltaproteobacteria bacterium]|nr:hypothetical protein [Deltaproteobacteria bacterium]